VEHNDAHGVVPDGLAPGLLAGVGTRSVSLRARVAVLIDDVPWQLDQSLMS
jgi:hypothetical protein